MVEHQARDMEVRGTKPGPGSNFSLEFIFKIMSNILTGQLAALIKHHILDI